MRRKTKFRRHTFHDELPPIQDQRLSDRIAQQFTQAMQSGELTVGTRLPPEAQLADQLGVSRGFCARR